MTELSRSPEKKGAKRQALKAELSCGACAQGEASPHPDHSAELQRLRRARGQLRGIEAMVDERRYCVDILTQLRAAGAALRAVEVGILSRHVESCVREAIEARDPKASRRKVDELTKLFLRRPS